MKNHIYRKYKKCILAAMLCVTAVILAGCGDGEESSLGQDVVSVTAQPLLSQLERTIYDHEYKYSNGGFVLEDYYALSSLYEETGRIRKQRDLLEECYRLHGDEKSLEMLQSITVNLAEEDEDIRKEAQTLLDHLELAEYRAEAISSMSNSLWMEIMMPKLMVGQRNYYLEREGEVVLTIQVGFDEQGKAYSSVWYTGETGRILSLEKQGSILKVLDSGYENGVYNGDFEAWTLNGETGDIIQERGTLSEGVYTGKYSVNVQKGSFAMDLYSLWSSREGAIYTSYFGCFDEQGRTLMEQPAQKDMQTLLQGSGYTGAVAYAYDLQGVNCLFMGVEEGAVPTACNFDMDFMGWGAYPVFETYEVVSDGNQSESTDFQEGMAKVRVYDGQIQYYDGNKWVNAGRVDELAAQDPFAEYAALKDEQNVQQAHAQSGLEGGSSVLPENMINSSIGAGVLSTAVDVTVAMPGVTPEATAEPTETPDPTQAPAATTKPTATAAPVVTARPTTAPTAKPTTAPTVKPTETPDRDDDDDDDDSGSSSGGSGSVSTPKPTEKPTPKPTEKPTPKPTEKPTPEPTEEPTPEPTEEPTPEPEEPEETEKPSQGGDVDVEYEEDDEWSEDDL